MSSVTMMLGAGSPKHRIVIAREPRTNVPINLCTNKQEFPFLKTDALTPTHPILAESQEQLVGVRADVSDPTSLVFTSGKLSIQAEPWTEDTIEQVLSTYTAVLLFNIENPADQETARMILQKKKEIGSNTQILLFGSLEQKQALKKAVGEEDWEIGGLVFDFFVVSGGSFVPPTRVRSKVKEAAKLWLGKQEAKERLATFTYTLLSVLQLKDAYTAGHSTRTTAYALALAKLLGIPPYQISLLKKAGLLHDIGKVGVPDAVLLKPGNLEPDEFEKIKAHPAIGATLLDSMLTGRERGIIGLVRSHHEKVNGRGYPDGTKASDGAPLLHRILPVADAWDAMTSDRPYRKGLTTEIALAEIRKWTGQQFDPEAAHAFEQALGEGIEIVGD